MVKRSNIKPTKLGIFVKERRTQLGLMAKDVAERAGLPGSAIARIESGFHTHPSPRTLEAVAQALDVSLLDLMAEAGTVPKGTLPSLAPYLRAKYDLPESIVCEIEKFLEHIGQEHGLELGDHPSDRSPQPPQRRHRPAA